MPTAAFAPTRRSRATRRALLPRAAFLLAALALPFGACRSADRSSPSTAAADVELSAAEAPMAAGSDVASANASAAALAPDSVRAAAMLLRTGEMYVRVSSLPTARTAAVRHVARLGGHVGNESETNGEYGAQATLALRVPAARYDSLVALLAGLGTVERRETTVEDVTRAFADLDARTRSRLATEQRYRELLAQAKNVEEVMAVEAKLSELRAEIESQQAQLRAMRDQAALSTLTLTLATTASGASGPSLLTRFVDALRDGGRLVVDLVVGLVRLWGVLLLAGLALVAWRRWIGPRWRRRRPVRPAPTPRPSEPA